MFPPENSIFSVQELRVYSPEAYLTYFAPASMSRLIA